MAEQRSSQPGLVLVISNKEFCDQVSLQETRDGAGMDEDNLKNVFETRLNFKLLGEKIYRDVHRDKRAENFFWSHDNWQTCNTDCNSISCLIQKTDFSGAECFVVVISSHGGREYNEQVICLSDEGLADRLKLSELIDALTDERCPSLKGIPRIIILTVCRADEDPDYQKYGLHEDKGVTIGATQDGLEDTFEKLSTDGTPTDISLNSHQRSAPEMASGDARTTNTDNTTKSMSAGGPEVIDEKTFFIEEMCIPDKALETLPSDFIVVFSTYVGKESIHDRTKGSWIISELRNVIGAHDFSSEPELNFLQALTKVSGNVAQLESKKGNKTTVTIYHRLTSPLIFKPSHDETPITDIPKPSFI